MIPMNNKSYIILIGLLIVFIQVKVMNKRWLYNFIISDFKFQIFNDISKTIDHYQNGIHELIFKQFLI